VEFELEGEKLFLPEGSCWYMNFNLPHAISNAGDTDRIHLVIDTRVNAWMEEIFHRPGLRRAETFEHDESTERQIIESLRLLNTAESHRIADEREEALGK
jgi:hypothetical protein